MNIASQIENVNSILGIDGAISRLKPDYEVRPQQIEMAEAVARAIANQTHLIVEAGTGVGKSYAYLIPAILHAIASKERFGTAALKVIVSTHTIPLQEQLLQKDIPFLRNVMPPFTAVLGKGRNNYISKRRLGIAIDNAEELFDRDEERNDLGRISHWASHTNEGSRSDLEFRPLPKVWTEIESDRNDCLSKKCPTYKECFLFLARARMKAANILVVNHALYMTDLALRARGFAFLPDHDLAIFDEAHTLEDVASDHFGRTVSNRRVLGHLARLWNDKKESGLVKKAAPFTGAEWAEEVAKWVEDLWSLSNEFFGTVQEDLGERQKKRFRTPPAWSDALAEGCAVLSANLNRVADKLDPPDDDEHEQRWDEDPEPDPVRDVGSALRGSANAFASISDDLGAWLRQAEHEAVFWTAREKKSIGLATAPLHVGPKLKELLFESIPTCILASATLATGKPPRFDHIRNRLGLAECETLQLGSPFDYRRQVELHLPHGLPDPGDPKRDEEYERLATHAIPHYLTKSRGRAFVLFTSYRMMDKATIALHPWIAKQGWMLLSQSDGMPRHKMIERFKAGDCILFGTSSFWAGVDVPGDALSNVIITRLPFRYTKDDPLIEARLEDIKIKGGNPFFDYQVPDAVIKLKQGFGRLIRTKTDMGMIVILDPRITTKFYGKWFLDSLPDCKRVREDISIPGRTAKGGA